MRAVSAIGLDLVHGTSTIGIVETIGFPEDKYLFAGVIDGRNIWANHLDKSLDILQELEGIVGKGMCALCTLFSVAWGALGLRNSLCFPN